MKLVTRLWLLGAVVPVIGAMLLVLVAGQLLDRSLRSALDRALLAQAAVESVSLFDGPDGKLHMHLERSSLLEVVRPFAPSATVYDASGQLRLAYPPGQPALQPNRPFRSERPGPELHDELDAAGQPHRVLTVSVRDSRGEPYLLAFDASLGQIVRATRTFHLFGFAGVSLLGVVLVVLQAMQGRRLRRRVGSLAAHLAKIERGELESDPAPDEEPDEIGALRGVLATATRAIRDAREAEARLVGEAAHELRTPLALMRTEIDLALRRPRSPEELRAALEGTRSEVDRLAMLAQKLLDLTQLGREPQRVPTDLRVLAEEALEQIGPAARGRELSLKLVAPATAPLSADPVGLRQVLLNLLDNAIKFSAPRGEISVHIEPENTGWRLVVSDSGPGIPVGEREHVFRPFHRLDSQAPGSGLGLAIVREVAERHGGRAYVAESATGAKMVVELPGAERAQLQASGVATR